MITPTDPSTSSGPAQRPRRAPARPAVSFALLCGLALASSLLCVSAEADDVPVVAAMSTLP